MKWLTFISLLAVTVGVFGVGYVTGRRSATAVWAGRVLGAEGVADAAVAETAAARRRGWCEGFAARVESGRRLGVQEGADLLEQRLVEGLLP